MIRLLNLFQRVGLLRPAPKAPPRPVATIQDDAERVAQLIVERLGEDEALRATLTDAGFRPIFGFISGLVPAAVARSLPGSTADEAEESVSHTARMLARAIAAAAASGDTTGVPQALTPPIIPESALNDARSALPAVLPETATGDERAGIIVEALSGAIAGARQ